MREMRLVQMMHGGLGFKRDLDLAPNFSRSPIRNGRSATGAPGNGELAPGAPADFVTLDLDRLDRDRIMPVDPLDLLFARGNASLLREVVVDGRTIVRDGRCLGVDLPAIETELRDIYRANVKAALKFPARMAAAVGFAAKTGSKRSSPAAKAVILQNARRANHFHIAPVRHV